VKASHRKGMFLICMLIPSCWAFGQMVRLPEGTPVRVRLVADLTSEQAAEGARVDFAVASPVVIQAITVIPEGAVAWGAVQSVKAGKYVKFDIAGVRLPDLTEIRLRCLRVRAKNVVQDEIKVESSFKGGVGAPKGSEYTAYVNEDKEVAVSGQPGSVAAPAATAPVAPVTGPAPSPASAAPTAAPGTSAVTSATQPAAPEAPSAVSPSPVATPPAKTERITVECFSDPSGADILIDGEFYGNTPSILKLPVGKHELEFQLSGYKTYAMPLILQPDSTIRTIRHDLEPKE